jgi:hypothetical protein
MTTPGPTRALFAILANVRDERAFARQVDGPFAPDPAAIARVRAAVLAQAPQLIKVQPRQAARWSAGSLTWQTVGLAAVLAIAVAGGIAIADLRSAPAPGSSAGWAYALPAASTATANGAPMDLDQSQATLANVLTTARSGDASALMAVLVDYEADLKAVAADLRRPGADVSAARAQLVTQASGLSAIAPSVTADNAAVFHEVSGELAALIASLPVTATPDPAKPADRDQLAAKPPPTHAHAPAPAPKPARHPGKGDGSDKAAGNGDGNGNGNGNGDGKGDENGKGNGNAGDSSNGKGHDQGQ